jgi:hypothetical protein
MATRSFRQKRRSTRFKAMGLTFQVSPLMLINPILFHPAGLSDDAITWAHHDVRSRIDGTSAFAEFADEAIVEAGEVGSARFGKIEVSEELPCGDRSAGHDGIANLAEPAHPPCEEDPWDPVGEKEIEIFLQQQSVTKRPEDACLSHCTALIEVFWRFQGIDFHV